MRLSLPQPECRPSLATRVLSILISLSLMAGSLPLRAYAEGEADANPDPKNETSTADEARVRRETGEVIVAMRSHLQAGARYNWAAARSHEAVRAAMRELLADKKDWRILEDIVSEFAKRSGGDLSDLDREVGSNLKAFIDELRKKAETDKELKTLLETLEKKSESAPAETDALGKTTAVEARATARRAPPDSRPLPGTELGAAGRTVKSNVAALTSVGDDGKQTADAGAFRSMVDGSVAGDGEPTILASIFNFGHTPAKTLPSSQLPVHLQKNTDLSIEVPGLKVAKKETETKNGVDTASLLLSLAAAGSMLAGPIGTLGLAAASVSGALLESFKNLELTLPKIPEKPPAEGKDGIVVGDAPPEQKVPAVAKTAPGNAQTSAFVVAISEQGRNGPFIEAQLKKLGPEASRAAVPLLTKALSSQDENTRQGAALAISKIGGNDANAVSAYKAMLASEDSTLRQYAAEAIAKVSPASWGKNADTIVEALGKAAADERGDERGYAGEIVMKAIEGFGPQGVKAIPGVLAGSTAKSQWTREAASRTLASFGAAAKPVLLDALADKDAGVRAAAVAALAKQGKGVVGDLLAHMGGDGGFAATQALARLNRTVPVSSYLPQLIGILNGKDARAAANAAQLIGYGANGLSGEARTQALAALESSFISPDRNTRLRAAQAYLGLVERKESVAALGVLVEALASEDESGRRFAARELAKASRVYLESAVEHYMQSASLENRVALASRLRALGDSGESALGQLLQDKDEKVRDAAVTELRQMGDKGTWQMSLALIQQKGDARKKIAREILAIEGSKAEHRIEAAEALAEEGERGEAMKELRSLASNEKADIKQRRAAAAQLSKLGDPNAAREFAKLEGEELFDSWFQARKSNPSDTSTYLAAVRYMDRMREILKEDAALSGVVMPKLIEFIKLSGRWHGGESDNAYSMASLIGLYGGKEALGPLAEIVKLDTDGGRRNTHSRRAAMKALSMLAHEQEVDPEIFIAWTKEHTLRAGAAGYALDGLANLGEKGKAGIPAVTAYLKRQDLNSNYGKDALRTLAAIGKGDPEVAKLFGRIIAENKVVWYYDSDLKMVLDTILNAGEAGKKEYPQILAFMLKKYADSTQGRNEFLQNEGDAARAALRESAKGTLFEGLLEIYDRGRASTPADYRRMQHWRSALALAAKDPDSPELISLLRASLKHEDIRIRRDAVSAIGFGGKHADALVADLIRSLDTHAYQAPEARGFRSLVEGALERIGPPSKERIPDLLKLLGEKDDERMRGLAIARLKAMGPDAKDALPALFDIALKEQDETNQAAALAAVEAIGPAGPSQAAAVLLSMGPEATPAMRDAAIKSLTDPAAIATLMQALGGERKDLRAIAQRVLSEMNSDAVSPALIQGLSKDSPLAARRAAAETLGLMGSQAAGAIDALIATLSDRAMRSASIEALGNIPGASDALANALDAGTDQELPISLALAHALRDGDPAIYAKAIPGLRRNLDSKDPVTRRKVLNALAALGSQETVKDVVGALGERHPDVREAAIAAAASIGLPAVDALVAALKGDPHAASAAAEALGRIGEGGAEKSLKPLLVYLGALKPGDPSRLKTVAALADLGTKASEASGILTTMLGRARTAAEREVFIEALGKIGSASPELVKALRLLRATPQHAKSATLALERLAAARSSSLASLLADAGDPDVASEIKTDAMRRLEALGLLKNGVLDPEAAGKELVSALVENRQNPAAVLPAIAAIAALGPDAGQRAKAAIQKLVTDPTTSAAVRSRALDAIGRLDPESFQFAVATHIGRDIPTPAADYKGPLPQKPNPVEALIAQGRLIEELDAGLHGEPPSVAWYKKTTMKDAAGVEHEGLSIKMANGEWQFTSMDGFYYKISPDGVFESGNVFSRAYVRKGPNGTAVFDPFTKSYSREKDGETVVSWSVNPWDGRFSGFIKDTTGEASGNGTWGFNRAGIVHAEEKGGKLVFFREKTNEDGTKELEAAGHVTGEGIRVAYVADGLAYRIEDAPQRIRERMQGRKIEDKLFINSDVLKTLAREGTLDLAALDEEIGAQARQGYERYLRTVMHMDKGTKQGKTLREAFLGTTDDGDEWGGDRRTYVADFYIDTADSKHSRNRMHLMIARGEGKDRQPKMTHVVVEYTEHRSTIDVGERWRPKNGRKEGYRKDERHSLHEGSVVAHYFVEEPSMYTADVEMHVFRGGFRDSDEEFSNVVTYLVDEQTRADGESFKWREKERWEVREDYDRGGQKWSHKDTGHYVGYEKGPSVVGAAFGRLGEAAEVVFSPFQSALYGAVGYSVIGIGHTFGDKEYAEFADFAGGYTLRQAKFSEYVYSANGVEGEEARMAHWEDHINGIRGQTAKSIRLYMDEKIREVRAKHYGPLWRFHQDDPISEQERADMAARTFGLGNLPDHYFTEGQKAAERGETGWAALNYLAGAGVIGGEMYVTSAGFGAVAQGPKMLMTASRFGMSTERLALALGKAGKIAKGAKHIRLTAAEARAVSYLKWMNRTEMAYFMAPAGLDLGTAIPGLFSGDKEVFYDSLKRVMTHAGSLGGMGLGLGVSKAQAWKAARKGPNPYQTLHLQQNATQGRALKQARTYQTRLAAELRSAQPGSRRHNKIVSELKDIKAAQQFFTSPEGRLMTAAQGNMLPPQISKTELGANRGGAFKYLQTLVGGLFARPGPTGKSASKAGAQEANPVRDNGGFQSHYFETGGPKAAPLLQGALQGLKPLKTSSAHTNVYEAKFNGRDVIVKSNAVPNEVPTNVRAVEVMKEMRQRGEWPESVKIPEVLMAERWTPETLGKLQAEGKITSKQAAELAAGERFVMVQERIPEGAFSLFDVLNGKVDAGKIPNSVMQDAVAAVRKLNENGVGHNDFANPTNIMLREVNGKYEIYLLDFGQGTHAGAKARLQWDGNQVLGQFRRLQEKGFLEGSVPSASPQGFVSSKGANPAAVEINVVRETQAYKDLPPKLREVAEGYLKEYPNATPKEVAKHLQESKVDVAWWAKNANRMTEALKAKAAADPAAAPAKQSWGEWFGAAARKYLPESMQRSLNAAAPHEVFLTEAYKQLPKSLRDVVERYYNETGNAAAPEAIAKMLKTSSADPAWWSDHGVNHMINIVLNMRQVLRSTQASGLIEARDPTRAQVMDELGRVNAALHDMWMKDLTKAGRAVHPHRAAREAYSKQLDAAAADILNIDVQGRPLSEVLTDTYGIPKDQHGRVIRELMAMSYGHSKSNVPLEVLNDPAKLRQTMKDVIRQQEAAHKTPYERFYGKDGADFDKVAFDWIERSPQLKADMADMLRALRVGDAFRWRGSANFRGSNGASIAIGRFPDGTVDVLMRLADPKTKRVYQVRYESGLALGEANTRRTEFSSKGDLVFGIETGSFGSKTNDGKVADGTAHVAFDVYLDFIRSFNDAKGRKLVIEKPAGTTEYFERRFHKALLDAAYAKGFGEARKAALKEGKSAAEAIKAGERNGEALKQQVKDSVVVTEAAAQPKIVEHTVEYMTRAEVEHFEAGIPIQDAKGLAQAIEPLIRDGGVDTSRMNMTEALGGARVLQFGEGATVMGMGAKGNFVYIPIDAGLHPVIGKTYSPVEMRVGVPIGETSLLTGNRRNADVVVRREGAAGKDLPPVRVLAIPKNAYLKHWVKGIYDHKTILPRLRADYGLGIEGAAAKPMGHGDMVSHFQKTLQGLAHPQGGHYPVIGVENQGRPIVTRAVLQGVIDGPLGDKIPLAGPSVEPTPEMRRAMQGER